MTGTPERFEFETVGNPRWWPPTRRTAAEDVPLDAPIVVDFSTLMDTASVEAAIEVAPSTDLVACAGAASGSPSCRCDGWEPNRRYSLTIGIGARDQAGTPLERPSSLSFRTVAAGLTVEALVPADGVAGHLGLQPDRARLRPAARPRERRMTTCSPSSRPWRARWTWSRRRAPRGCATLRLRILRFQPSGPLDPNTTYQVTLGPGLLGADGTGMPAGHVLDLHHRSSDGDPLEPGRLPLRPGRDREPVGHESRRVEPAAALRRAVTGHRPIPSRRTDVPSSRVTGPRSSGSGTDGTARRLLTDPGVIEFDAAYSPDGTVITFGRADPALGSGLGLWMRDADGSDPRPIELPSGSASVPVGKPVHARAAAARPAHVPRRDRPRLRRRGRAGSRSSTSSWIS